ncbi:phospholipase A-2-activating protein-like [Lineus longissimus]|uniref:phospholipase A-2-activating protein-like n=1 Tax=Lineus longissimus TaxID=88925 RepID=UPI002B4F74F7
MASYKLRCSLAGHQKDVRALYAPSFYGGRFLSGSRDKTAKVWKPIEHSTAFDATHSLTGHTNFISAVCVTVPSPTYPDGLIYTASNDRTILAYIPDISDPIFKLTGHENTVCTLATGGFGTLLSGSWDLTAKVWSQDKCLMTLKGHAAAVWAVAVMPQHGYMLTGSADKSIRLWKAGKCERTLTGHTDCVRGLAVFSEHEFLSCSNDASIKKWLITGECTMTYYAHTNYVYGIAIIPDSKDFVTTGEDRTLRVWHDEECVQTITHPAQSVWAVCCLPNGDIATGGSDSMVRVFTRAPERVADPDELKAYEDEVSNSAIPTQIGDIKIENLPGPEVLLEPGNKDGQTKMVRVGGKAECHQWSGSEGRWVKVGDVVGAAGGGGQGQEGKKMFEGKEYDYVFDVDIEEGMPPLKLPFNISDDPWMAAQEFIHKNELSQMFLDQIANFIYKNTEGVTLGQKSAPNVDPYTGASRYIPQDDTEPKWTGGSDPFTGGSRYIPDGMEDNSSKPAPSRGAGDPAASTQFFPKTTCLVFDSANQNAVIAKIRDFNGQVAPDLKVDPNDLEYLTSMMNAKGATPLQIELLDKLLQWPIDKQFPCLDVLRLAIRSDCLNEHFCGDANGVHFLQGMLRTVSPGSPPANQMLALRTLSNAFLGRWGQDLLLKNRDSVITAILNVKESTNKNIQIGVATMLLNYTIVLQKCDDVEAKSQCLLAAHTMIDCVKDLEAKFRLLVAIGNMVHSDENGKALAQSLDMANIARSFVSIQDPVKLSKCAQQVLNVL